MLPRKHHELSNQELYRMLLAARDADNTAQKYELEHEMCQRAYASHLEGIDAWILEQKTVALEARIAELELALQKAQGEGE